ncbi:MAG TPA: IS3 family transposase [Ktedonobacteraceae bacterium]|nr:IS3 family transposase [Ktedonobacteraceae bacterium]
MSQHAQSDTQVAEQIRSIYQAHRTRYGSPRTHVELQEQGMKCARKRVARLMREQGLVACRPRHRTITTQSNGSARVAPNHLNRAFTATRPAERKVDRGYHRDLDIRGVALLGSGP